MFILSKIPKRSFITFINTSTTGVKQTFGKTEGLLKKNPILNPGINFYIPIIQKINIVSNKQQQIIFAIACRSIDGVSVNLNVSIQYLVKPENSILSLFSLENPLHQMNSLVNDSIRSSIASIKIDDVYIQQNEISNIVTSRLQELEKHGFTCTNVLLKDIEPDKKVKDSMNLVNSSLREKLVAIQQAEADYIKITKHAEARSKEMALIGKGMSDQRNAILQGYSDNMISMSKNLGVTSNQLMSFLTRMQEIDMNREIAHSNNSKIIFIPKSDTDFDKSIMYGNETKI